MVGQLMVKLDQFTDNCLLQLSCYIVCVQVRIHFKSSANCSLRHLHVNVCIWYIFKCFRIYIYIQISLIFLSLAHFGLKPKWVCCGAYLTADQCSNRPHPPRPRDVVGAFDDFLIVGQCTIISNCLALCVQLVFTLFQDFRFCFVFVLLCTCVQRICVFFLLWARRTK